MKSDKFLRVLHKEFGSLGSFVVFALLILCILLLAMVLDTPPFTSSKPIDNTTNDLRQINQELKDIHERLVVIEKKVADMKARGEL